jgi:hypothetical protein
VPWKLWECSLRTHSYCKHWLHMSALWHPRKYQYSQRMLLCSCTYKQVEVAAKSSQTRSTRKRTGSWQNALKQTPFAARQLLILIYTVSTFLPDSSSHVHTHAAGWCNWRYTQRRLAAELKHSSACRLSQLCRMQGCTQLKEQSLEGLQQLWMTRDVLCDRPQ